jgi:hypothetical protein
MSPEERARAVAQHFSGLSGAQRAEVEQVVTSAIRRAVAWELRNALAVVQPLYLKPCVDDRDGIRFDVFSRWQSDLLMRLGNYTDPATLKASSLLSK